MISALRNENTEGNTSIVLTLDPESAEKLIEAGVAEIRIRNSAGRSELAIDVKGLKKELDACPGAKLEAEVETGPAPDRTAAEGMEEGYRIDEDSMISVLRIALVKEDGTEAEPDPGCFTVRMETASEEGAKVLYVNPENETSDTDALYKEAAEDAPGYLEIPFQGNGVYLSALPAV